MAENCFRGGAASKNVLMLMMWAGTGHLTGGVGASSKNPGNFLEMENPGGPISPSGECIRSPTVRRTVFPEILISQERAHLLTVCIVFVSDLAWV